MNGGGSRWAIVAVLACAASGAMTGWWLLRARPNAEPAPKTAPIAPLPQPLATPTRRVVGEPAVAAQTATVAGDDHLARRNNEAIQALGDGKLERAIELFESCLREAPGQLVFAHNLAEALARKAVAEREERHPCPHCIELLTRAVELAPERADIADLLAHCKRELELEKDFWRESSQHFDLAYDGERDEILSAGNRILNQLEDHYVELERFFGASPVDEGRPRIAVSLYQREGFSALTGLGDWAGGAFDGAVRIPIGDFEREERGLDGVMRHELAHAFIRALGGTSVPAWLSEGLAQWLEPGRTGAVAAARAKLSGGELFPLERLAGSIASWKDPDEIARAYAQSLVLVDWIAGRFGERLVVDLVVGCKTSQPPTATFENSTRIPLESAFGEYARK
ncbi:MAG: DUF1570 domain-containing protein [Planctomycetes bacterium]|nr:DUF1570 domain-containing protein [Planctomycetota bacterium]